MLDGTEAHFAAQNAKLLLERQFLGANIFATTAEHNTSVWINHCFLFAALFLQLEGLHVAEINAFPACGALAVVYFWIPRYFIPGDSSIFCFGHISNLYLSIYNKF